jgi:hypothetical protein
MAKIWKSEDDLKKFFLAAKLHGVNYVRNVSGTPFGEKQATSNEGKRDPFNSHPRYFHRTLPFE